MAASIEPPYQREPVSDTLSPKARSERMSRVKAKDTKPEMTLRRLVHGLGFRYRLHRRDLPGTPDLVFPGRGAVIFMHGCFWHRHPGCGLTRMPKSRVEFWRTKLEANRERDLRHQRELAEMGWRVLVVWECELRDLDAVARKVEAFLTQEEA
ncbi:MAG: very short patch repair endonuclease [Verrucomicrobiota bacterium JB024]|nr:very short patch repair endonuclease [Verrucomicrobiota bacterium JB024]